MNSSHSVRLEDIARQLKLSVATISRALSGDPRVRPSTRERVLQAAAQLGYVPNTIAQSLRKGRTNTLGVLIPKYDDPFFMQIIKGIEHYARQQRFKVLLSSSEQSYRQECENIQNFLEGGIDGLLICLSKDTRDYKHIIDLIARKIPVVQFDCVDSVIPTDRITTSDLKGAKQATTYLLEKGHRRIAYLGGPDQLDAYKNRFQGYQDALQKYDISFDPQLVMHSNEGTFAGDSLVINTFLERLSQKPRSYLGQ